MDNPLTNLTSAIKSELEKRQQQIADKILSGTCPDYASYKDMTGEYRGLTHAIEASRRTVAAYMNDENFFEEDDDDEDTGTGARSNRTR